MRVLKAACEMGIHGITCSNKLFKSDQLSACNVQGDDMEAWLLPFPKVRAWMTAVREATAPVYDEVHVLMNKAAARFKERKAAAQSKL